MSESGCLDWRSQPSRNVGTLRVLPGRPRGARYPNSGDNGGAAANSGGMHMKYRQRPRCVTSAASGRRARLPKDGKPDTVYWK